MTKKPTIFRAFKSITLDSAVRRVHRQFNRCMIQYVKTAKTLEEVKELLAAGFEHAKDHDGVSVFRKIK